MGCLPQLSFIGNREKGKSAFPQDQYSHNKCPLMPQGIGYDTSHLFWRVQETKISKVLDLVTREETSASTCWQEWGPWEPCGWDKPWSTSSSPLKALLWASSGKQKHAGPFSGLGKSGLVGGWSHTGADKVTPTSIGKWLWELISEKQSLWILEMERKSLPRALWSIF